MKLTYPQFNKQLIKLFADNTGCGIQYRECPCNSCFHSIKEVDFQHIVWLILLAVRGDYDKSEMLKEIKKELDMGD